MDEGKLTPAVFAVGDTYHIMLYTKVPTLVRAKVGGKFYYDESNGIMRSESCIHRVIVPQKQLDESRSYTICQRPIIERKPYFTETEEEFFESYEFIPVSGEKIRAYHIADAHNMIEQPVRAAETYGEIDFLILNGDIPDHSGSVENCLNIYRITSAITEGKIPTVFSRGNHDMRGVHAEQFADYTPTDNGKSYYTFRLGSIWGIILDCGEDKDDSSNEYGYTICCHAFRERETEFLNSVIRNAEQEYLAEGVTKRLVISHVPFERKSNPPFDIENEIYTEWTRLLREEIQPDLMIAGHEHTIEIDWPDSEKNYRNLSCPVVIGATTDYKDYFAGAGLAFDENGVEVTFTDSECKVKGQEWISFSKE